MRAGAITQQGTTPDHVLLLRVGSSFTVFAIGGPSASSHHLVWSRLVSSGLIPQIQFEGPLLQGLWGPGGHYVRAMVGQSAIVAEREDET